MAEEEVSAGDSDSGGVTGRMVTGSPNLPGPFFMSGGSLLMPEARLRQEGSMDSGVPDGLAGQAAGVATTPSSFLLSQLVSGFFALSASHLFFMRKLPCLVVHLWGPGPGTFFIWKSSCISSCQWVEGKPNLSTELTTRKALGFRLPSGPSCSDLA